MQTDRPTNQLSDGQLHLQKRYNYHYQIASNENESINRQNGFQQVTNSERQIFIANKSTTITLFSHFEQLLLLLLLLTAAVDDVVGEKLALKDSYRNSAIISVCMY